MKKILPPDNTKEGSLLPGKPVSMFDEFDPEDSGGYIARMSQRTKRTVYLPPEIIHAAALQGLSVNDYILHLHLAQGSVRASFVASVLRGFALLEMARVPLDPAYYDLVDGVLGLETGRQFRTEAGSGIQHALAHATANLLGADTRVEATKAILITAQRANVMHEGFLEAARLLESTSFR